MTKLEEEIFLALGDSIDTLDADCTGEYGVYAKAAAEVAKKYIKEAILAAFKNHTDVWNDPDKAMSSVDFYDYWLKENGII